MREALKGSWILQEYADSIDAGLTPKLLEYMLDRQSLIVYAVDPWDTTNKNNTITIANEETNKDEDYIMIFKCAENKIELFSKYDSLTREMPKYVATVEFVSSEPDMVLHLYNDSLKDKPVSFIKYDVGKCPHITPYSHLVHSKFIAGKYYGINDIERKHHIIFTRCGSIEGAENIDPLMRFFGEYGTVITNFRTNPDVIVFINAEYNKAAKMSWEVNHDSLILYHAGDVKDSRIVLVKAL